MKLPALITLILFSVMLTTAHAQFLVEDVASIAQDAVDQVVDLGKYVEMVNNQVQQIKTMKQELDQVTAYTEAFGDPSQLTSIVGADSLMEGFQQSGVGQTLGTLNQTASGIDSLQNNASGLYQSIASTSFSGIEIPREADAYKPYAALENTSSNYSSVYDDVMQRRQTLKGQMMDTVGQLQNSTTDAETQKLQGVVTAQAAQLQAIDQEVTDAATQAVVQDIANRNNEEKQQQANNEEIAADRHDAMTKFGGMMLPDVNSDLRFGRSNP